MPPINLLSSIDSEPVFTIQIKCEDCYSILYRDVSKDDIEFILEGVKGGKDCGLITRCLTPSLNDAPFNTSGICTKENSTIDAKFFMEKYREFKIKNILN